MIRRPHGSKRSDTPFPSTTLFRVLASFGVVLSKAVSNWKAGRLFTPEEGGGTAAGLFRYSSVINWFRPPAGQPPGHHEGRGVLRPIGDALGVVQIGRASCRERVCQYV